MNVGSSEGNRQHQASLEQAVLRPAQDRRYDLLAMAFCLFIAVLALWLGSFREVGNWGVETDFFERDVIQAARIVAGQPYTNHHYPPGYAYLLALSSHFTHDMFTAGKILTGVSVGLIGLVSYRLLTILWGRRPALAAIVLTLLALLPYAVVASADMVVNLALLVSMWMLLRHETTRAVCAMAGIAAGVAYLLRYNALFVLVGAPVALLILGKETDSWKKRLGRIGVFSGAALIVMAPWLLVNWHRNGNPFSSDLYQQVAAHFYHPQGDGFGRTIAEMGQRFTSPWDVMVHDPLRIAKRFFKDVLYTKAAHLTWRVIEFPAALFAGAGLLLYFQRMTKKRAAFLILCMAGYLLHGLAGFAVRFYFFLFPLLFALVVLPIFYFERMPISGRVAGREWAVGWWVFGLVALAATYSTYVSTSQFLRLEPKHLLEAASMIKSRAVAGDRIMAIEPHLAHLTGLEVTSAMVADSLDQYLATVAGEHIRFLVYSEHEEDYWPGLHSLSQPNQLPKGYRVIYQHGPSRTIVYEIEGAAASP
ncbi:hypothetical protein W02_26700 [Nitrospira sp. KM1]|uniref:ArnT family glycosyltransferase n=1 Tax=Nitrospira sp. KM1 TaxID=1936990 RepID=UPI0013A785DE|nr:glycosyltransferase family 39 protein [Nitrospira sp. KM1]BCA55530.1 hypothetical protein W02_26700 [Nitrospira sp. KM1]